MQTETRDSSPIAQIETPLPAPSTRSSLRLVPLWLSLALLWFILCRHLSNEWSANEQYSYGWFVPFFAAFLFWLRFESKLESRNEKVAVTAAQQRPGFQNGDSGAFSKLLLSTFSFLLFLLLPLRLFEIGNPDWRPLGWVHALAVVGLTLLVIRHIGGPAWVRHFAFPVCFIFVAVPWVTPIEAPIVQGLMRSVATIASEAANLLGIPAQLEGSVIRVSNGVVGVNEACSGVRSLQTSLMIGLLFGELKRLSVQRRVLLVFLAAAVAFAANCGRAFFLVWIAATRNLEAVGAWHDVAGYAIVALVFVATYATASRLAPNVETTVAKAEDPESTFPNPAFNFRLPTFTFLLFSILWIVTAEVGAELWYRGHERNLVATAIWNVTWPESAPGFRDLEINENVRSTLRYDQGREATWLLPLANNEEPIPNHTRAGAGAAVSMFFFRWEPGTTSLLRARSHRPDICLPNTGWRLLEDRGVRSYDAGGGLTMPIRHFAFARAAGENREIVAHAFFCEREDRVPRRDIDQVNVTAGTTSNWMRSDRLRLVREGLRNQGQQVLELVMTTPREFGSAAAETEFARLMPRIVTAERNR